MRSFWPSALLARGLLATAGIFALLEFWRPYFFLTDDNVSGAFPYLTEIGRHLKSGRSPFYSDYLFGGHYNLLRDATYFAWSPLNFAVSLLADTPAQFAMCDLIAFFNFMFCAAGFILLGQRLRADLRLTVTDGRLLFLTLSFVFSTFILTTGASWVNILANQMVQPWLALGLWQATWRKSFGILFGFSLYQALTGHTACDISNALIFTLFALLVCRQRRSLQPLVCWIAANVATFIVILPLVLPALSGFVHSERSAGLSIELLQRFSLPAALVPISLLFGNFFEMAARIAHIPEEQATFFMFPRLPTLLACAAAWCVFPLILQRRRWTLLEGGCAGLVVLLLVLIVRPTSVTILMSHVPLLRSMRWPFREILQLLFFFHLLLVLRPWAGAVTLQNRIACCSAGLFALPLFFSPPLTLNPLRDDRTALLSGEGERYWRIVKTQLGPHDLIATVMEPDLWAHSQNHLNYGLIGTADFPAYYQVPCVSGYSQTAPLDQLPFKTRPYYWFGAYSPDQVPALLAAHLNVRIITVSGFHPLRVTLSSKKGPIDLSPLVNGY